jgi:hypothetical protein
MRQRKTVFRLSGFVIALLMVMALTIGLAGIAHAESAPAIQTDQTKYSLGETMVISGAGFTPNGIVHIEVLRPDHEIDALGIRGTGASGTFQTTYTPPMIPGRYKITATDGIDTAKTAATEADAVGYNKEVYNKDTTAIVLPTGKWTPGNAGKYYKEDQWAYYQYEITGIPGSDVPTFNVVFNHYQSNTNAIFIDAFCDFRYAWNTPMLANNVPYPGNSTSTWHTWLPNKINYAYDPSTHTLSYPSTDAPAEVNGFAVDDPASMFATGAPTSGTNTLVIYFRAHLASSTVWMAGDEANLGSLIPPDDAAVPSGAGGIYGTDVYTNWTAPFYGVGFASGSSRHFNLQDQSAGPSGAITLPIPTVGANYIIIQKVTDPTHATGAVFNFTASGDDISPTTFTLDTDPGTTTIYDLIRFSDLPTGTGAHAVDYIFTETTLPEHWSLTDITCENILGTNTFTIDLSSKTVTVRLNKDGAAICTFNNTMEKTGCLEVQKVIDKSNVIDGELDDLADALFSVNITGPSYPGGEIVTFNFTDGVLYVYNGTAWVEGDTYCLCDLIPGNYTASEAQAEGWEAGNITGSPALVEAGDTCDGVDITVTNSPTPGCLEVTKVVDLDDYMFASSANATFNITVTGPSYPTGLNLTFEMVNGDVFYVDDFGGDTACLCNLIPGSYNVTETPPDGWGDVNITNDSPAVVAAGDACGVNATVVTVTNTLLIPHTTINITADFYETTPGGNVWLYISDTNDGEVPLTDPSVTLLVGADPPIELVKGDAYWSVGPPTWAISSGTSNGDTGDDGIMGVDETWYWAVQVTLNATTNITVNGHGTDPLGNPVDGPTYSSETGTITVRVGGATRTWGFWKTHLWLVQWMFDPAGGNISLPIDLGTWNGQDMLIDSVCKYMGLMWCDQTKNSDGGKREKIDAARIHTAHQALAAIMNSYMAGGAPLPGGMTVADIADILTNGTEKEIRDLGSLLAGYNESGEDVALDPSLPPTGKTTGNIADPQGGRLIGAPCEPYWDTPEASKGAPAKGKSK